MRQSTVVTARRTERKSHAECGTERLKVKREKKEIQAIVQSILCYIFRILVICSPKCDLIRVNRQAFNYIHKCFLKYVTVQENRSVMEPDGKK